MQSAIAIITISILMILLIVGAICVVTKAGSKEGICKYGNKEDNDNDNEEIE